MIFGGYNKAHVDKFIEKGLGPSCISEHGVKLCSSGKVYHDCSGQIAVVVEGAVYGREHSHSWNASLPHIIEENLSSGFQEAVLRALEGVDGEFAFAALYRGRLALARDRLGTRPLYLSGRNFSTWHKAKPLNPGQALFLSASGESSKEIERLPERLEVDSPERELGRALAGAVEKRSLFAGRFGILYSGGLDSALLAKIAVDLGYRPRLYVVGTETSLDRGRSKEARELFGLEAVFREVKLEDVEGALPEVVSTIGSADPLQVSLALPLHFAAGEASAGGEEYMLSGQGSDELFGGYHRYLSFGSRELEEELRRDLLELHFKNLERDYRVAGMHGVELLNPFLDRKVVQIALSLSSSLKVGGGRRKLILREVARRLGLPEKIAERKKKALQYSSGINKLLDKLAGKRKREHFGRFLSGLP